MGISRCISSQLVTGLLSWRSQENDIRGLISTTPTSRQKNHIGKIAVAEVGLCLLTAAATVETVAYTVLTALSLPLLPFSKKAFTFCAKKLESSSFTTAWAFMTAVRYNFTLSSFPLHESFARLKAKSIVPFSFMSPLRTEDMAYIRRRIEQSIITLDARIICLNEEQRQLSEQKQRLSELALLRVN